MANKIPHRIAWAVTMLGIEGPETLLEIGCGTGVAASLIAPSLTHGRILAIDRSAKAIAAARDRNLGSKAEFRPMPLANMAGTGDRFDKIFAINVNLFWTDPQAGLQVVKSLLTETGTFFLFYEPPEAPMRKAIAEKVAAGFSASGLSLRKTVIKDIEDRPLLCLIAGLERVHD